MKYPKQSSKISAFNLVQDTLGIPVLISKIYEAYQTISKRKLCSFICSSTSYSDILFLPPAFRRNKVLFSQVSVHTRGGGDFIQLDLGGGGGGVYTRLRMVGVTPSGLMGGCHRVSGWGYLPRFPIHSNWGRGGYPIQS